MKPYYALLMIPALASAQTALPPGYNLNHCVQEGQEINCLAVSPTSPEFAFSELQPQEYSNPADPPAVSVPEITSKGAIAAFTFLGILVAIFGRRKSSREM